MAPGVTSGCSTSKTNAAKGLRIDENAKSFSNNISDPHAPLPRGWGRGGGNMIAQITDLPYPNDGSELFADRYLNIVWLTPGFWHSPSLHALPSGVESWHWRCDPLFLSWLNAVAKKAGDGLSREARIRADFIRSCICLAYDITDDNWQEKMAPPGAKLPMEMLQASIGLCDIYCGPIWPGIEDMAIEMNFASFLRSEVFDHAAYRAHMRSQENAVKGKRRKPKADDVPF